MDAGVLISIIIAVIGIAITVAIYMGSTRAVKIQQTQEDPDSYFRSVGKEAWSAAQKMYEGTINQLEDAVTRQGVQINEQNEEIIRLNRENIKLRRKISSEDDSGPQPKIP